MFRRILVFALFAGISICLPGQQCPQVNGTGANHPSEIRAVEGQLVFHDGIRKWFELRMDAPQCGYSSIQLVRIERDWAAIEVLRGCRVKSQGAIDFSATGYYSLDLYQDVKEIESIGKCEPQPLLPDYSKAKPNKSVQRYRVEMHVDYRPGDHPIIFRVTSAGRQLQPWQAYANYTLTGGFVLYGHCGDGFVVEKVFGSPQANPSHFTEPLDPSDMAAFDPENAAASGLTDLHLGYTCVQPR
jgi:hypothetical protein